MFDEMICYCILSFRNCSLSFLSLCLYLCFQTYCLEGVWLSFNWLFIMFELEESWCEFCVIFLKLALFYIMSSVGMFLVISHDFTSPFVNRVSLTRVSQLLLMHFSEVDILKRGLFLRLMRSRSYAILRWILVRNNVVKGIQMVNIYATFLLQFLRKWVDLM